MYPYAFGNYTTWENVFLSLMAIIIIIIFGGIIYAFLYAIILFIFSKGDENKIKQAWNSIRYAILGLIFTTFLLFIFPIIFQKLRIPGYKVYTVKNIFLKVSDILKNIFNETLKSTSSNSTIYEETNGL